MRHGRRDATCTLLFDNLRRRPAARWIVLAGLLAAPVMARSAEGPPATLGAPEATVDEGPPESPTGSAMSALNPVNWVKAGAKAVERPFTARSRERAELQDIVRDQDGHWELEGRRKDLTDTIDQQFEQADEYFRQEQYSQAAKIYSRLASRFKDTPVEEEALYRQAESEFMQNRLPKAQDTFAKLMTKYPTTRYLPQAVQRTYDIAFYWLEDSRLRSQGLPTNNSAFSQRVNFFDRSRPLLDTNGRAINAIETIQQHDPFGPLSDDAVMMAGAHKFVDGSYVEAAGYYEQLVADQPKSDHAPRALVLGAQAYLRSYPGPDYDGKRMDDAERLTKAALARGESLSDEQKHRLREDLRVIRIEKAKRMFIAGEDYRRLGKYTSAMFYYQQVMDDYTDTEWADKASAAMAEAEAQAERAARSPIAKMRRWWGERKSGSGTPAEVPAEAAHAEDVTDDAPASEEVAPRKLPLLQRVFGSDKDAAEEQP